MQFDERLKVLEERERAVADLEDADGREGLAEQAATTVQLRDAVDRQERRIEDLERNIESERYRRTVAESVLEDPSLMHNLAIENERLQSELADRERELELIAAQTPGDGTETATAPPEQLSELEGQIAVYEIELLELRARLEDVIDREFADLRESELKQEIERLAAQVAAGGEAGDAEEQLAPLRAELASALAEGEQASGRASELEARVAALESELAEREGAATASGTRARTSCARRSLRRRRRSSRCARPRRRPTSSRTRWRCCAAPASSWGRSRGRPR